MNDNQFSYFRKDRRRWIYLGYDQFTASLHLLQSGPERVQFPRVETTCEGGQA